MKKGICIAEKLGKCKGGCEQDFIDGLKGAGFSGLIIRSNGKKEKI